MIEQAIDFIIDVHQEVIHDPTCYPREDLTNNERNKLIADEILVRCIYHNKGTATSGEYWKGTLDAYTVDQIALMISSVATIFKFRFKDHGWQLIENGSTER